jgi:hypothetical protein
MRLIIAVFINILLASHSLAGGVLMLGGGKQSAGATESLQFDYSDAPTGSTYWASATTNQLIALSFTTSGAFTLTKVGIYLKKNNGSPLTAAVPVYIYSDSSFTPSSSIATSTSDISGTLGTSYVEYQATFSGVSLSGSTRYWIVLGGTIDAVNVPQWGYITGTEKRLAWNGSIWTGSITDIRMCAKIYGY